jgi:VWFA-related protein
MRAPATGLLTVSAFCILHSAFAWNAARAAQQQPPQPVFETKAELVLVDVNVVDRESKPVTTLAAGDFQLEVNGQTRPIASVQFISTTPANVTPAAPREAEASSNEAETTGRLLLFVVDESSLRVGASRSVLRTAQTLFERLAPGDLVGLARIPTGVGSVEFTTDRQRIVDGLMRVTGAATSRTGMSRVYIGEAWGLDSGDRTAFQQAVDRECIGEQGPALEACANQVESDARGLLMEASARARATLQALEGLMRNLARLNTPVNIVMVSEGMFVARDRQSMSELGRRAAEARATIHIIRPGQSFFDLEDRGLPSANSRFFDDALMSEGLEQVAGQTRGSMATVTGAGTGAFDRLGRELSGYYLIGFEPTDADRTGKERRIKVAVRPRGLTVRARPTFVIRDAAAADAEMAALTPLEQLGEVLKSPLPVRGLPIRVATYTAGDAGSSKVRVVIAAEVGEPATTPAEWPVGVIILDQNDRIVMNRGGAAALAPASPRGESPRLALTSVVLDPGEYTLRLAAVDDTGRGGSVHHTIHARLTPLSAGIRASDLMLVAQPPSAGELPRPRPSTVIDHDTVSAMLELTGSDQALLGRTKVTLQISDAVNGNPLVNVEARQAARGTVRAFAATLRLGVLPPGEYVARAIVAAPGQPEQRLTRAFKLSALAISAVEPPPDLGVPLDPDAPPPPVAPSHIVAPVPRFSPRTILTPGVVQPFLDGLADLHPPTAGVEAVLERARGGDYNVPDESGTTPEDQLNLAFVRGLAALGRGEVPQAAAWFQQTLKGASDFLGAAFYLGATHAMAGRDREAIGAWQMALLSENPGAVYPVLVDALLRVGDGRQALDVLEEAPAAWTDDNARLRREAIARAMVGDFSGALPKLKDQLDHTRNDDQPLLFVAIQVLFRMHQQDKSLSPDNLDRFRSYVERHQKLGGPDRALVETWRRAVLGR